MTRFDYSPLFRSTVGFDRMMRLLEASGRDVADFPAYDIEVTGETTYRITLAVAGYRAEDLAIEVRENTLTIKGKLHAGDDGETRYLHRGISASGFERRFALADFVEVTEARLEGGLLHIDLKRELPEAMKPRTIPIGSGPSKLLEGAVKRLKGEGKRAA